MEKFMELENMNKSYTNAKASLNKKSKLVTIVNQLEQKVLTLSRDIEDIQIAIIRAYEDKDNDKVKTLKESLKGPKEELAKNKAQLEKLRDVANRSQKAIDQQMEELSKDPALKAHLEEVTAKRFSRDATKKQKEKEQLLSENEAFEKIKATARENSKVMTALYDIEKHSKEIQELDKKINDPKTDPIALPSLKASLSQEEFDLSKSRGVLANCFKGTIKKDIIDKITSYSSLDRNIKANNRRIKGIDKQIANYEVALNNIGYTLYERESNSTEEPKNPYSSKITRSDEEDPKGKSGLPAEQPKWYQFIKRFKNWNNRRKLESKGPEAHEGPEEHAASVSEKEKSKFKNSMKYDIVKDYQEKMAADLLKQAKAQNIKDAKDLENNER